MYLRVFSFFMIAAYLFLSCGEDDPSFSAEPEVITSLEYILTPVAGGDPVILRFSDPDGNGGQVPTITVDNLVSNRTYTGQITLLNESVSPAANITSKIQGKAKEHQFFFTSNKFDLDVSYLDQDDDGNPVGLRTELKSGTIGTGKLNITLRHMPDKFTSGVSAGDISNAGGETNIQVTFDVVILP